MDEFTHHYANLKGVRIHYVTMGRGAPMVLLHGWPQSWYEWLGGRGEVLALSHFGASAPAKILFEKFGFTPERVVELASRLLG